MVLHTFHLFAGAGGGILADLLLGHSPIGAVEIDAYCRNVLLQRQRDGLLPAFPLWDDVRTMRPDNPDTRPFLLSLKERAEDLAICGGFPCQDISVAGKGAGLSGKRSGLWTEFARILSELRPRYAFIENTAALATRGLSRVLAELAALGMDARWCCLGADDVGAPHLRKRLWILAYASGAGCKWSWQAQPRCPDADASYGDKSCRCSQVDGTATNVADTRCLRLETGRVTGKPAAFRPLQRGESQCGCAAGGHAIGTGLALRRRAPEEWPYPTTTRTDAGPTQPSLGVLADGLAPRLGEPFANEPHGVPRMARGVPHRLDRLKALGNAQVPLCAALAWRLLTQGLPR